MALLDLQGLALVQASAPSEHPHDGGFSNLSLLAPCANSALSLLLCSNRG